ncbi:MAG: hypothetical protein E6Y96_21810, partial [Klebsiella pneumoniae]|nr:hypothetical protein [Klebsiella pneumoniae]MDU6004650.1 hypothetical protein [Klebsiella pneumoniae]MDU6087512.1 hypothetical protein [Klebsiella pneumoniae]
MSKKKNRKKASPTPLAPVQPQVAGAASFGYDEMLREGANKQVISSQADSLIKISRIWADFFPANTS